MQLPEVYDYLMGGLKMGMTQETSLNILSLGRCLDKKTLSVAKLDHDRQKGP